MKPLKVLLVVVDKALGVAQFVDGLLTRRRARLRFEELVRAQQKPDRSRAPTVILRRRPPPPR